MNTKMMNAIKDSKVEFCFVPSSKLKELVTQNDHPYIKSLPEHMKIAILSVTEGNAIGPIDNQMVLKYLQGTLDARQKFILDHSDVRVKGLLDIGTKQN